MRCVFANTLLVSRGNVQLAAENATNGSPKTLPWKDIQTCCFFSDWVRKARWIMGGRSCIMFESKSKASDARYPRSECYGVFEVFHLTP